MICIASKYERPSGTWRFLEKDEPLRKDDIMRYVSYDEEMSMDPERRMNWHTVAEGMGAWVGKTVKQYERAAQHECSYEFMRKCF